MGGGVSHLTLTSDSNSSSVFTFAVLRAEMDKMIQQIPVPSRHKTRDNIVIVEGRKFFFSPALTEDVDFSGALTEEEFVSFISNINESGIRPLVGLPLTMPIEKRFQLSEKAILSEISRLNRLLMDRNIYWEMRIQSGSSSSVYMNKSNFNNTIYLTLPKNILSSTIMNSIAEITSSYDSQGHSAFGDTPDNSTSEHHHPPTRRGSDGKPVRKASDMAAALKAKLKASDRIPVSGASHGAGASLSGASLGKQSASSSTGSGTKLKGLIGSFGSDEEHTHRDFDEGPSSGLAAAMASGIRKEFDFNDDHGNTASGTITNMDHSEHPHRGKNSKSNQSKPSKLTKGSTAGAPGMLAGAGRGEDEVDEEDLWRRDSERLRDEEYASQIFLANVQMLSELVPASTPRHIIETHLLRADGDVDAAAQSLLGEIGGESKIPGNEDEADAFGDAYVESDVGMAAGHGHTDGGHRRVGGLSSSSPLSKSVTSSSPSKPGKIPIEKVRTDWPKTADVNPQLSRLKKDRLQMERIVSEDDMDFTLEEDDGDGDGPRSTGKDRGAGRRGDADYDEFGDDGEGGNTPLSAAFERSISQMGDRK